MKRPSFHLVCGLPGTGKTTLARHIEEQEGAIRLCPDEWMQQLGVNLWDEDYRARIEALQWDLAKQLLRRGVSVIVEWGTWGRSERDALREGATGLGVITALHVLDTDDDTLYERLVRRGMEDPPVTRQQVAEWRACFQIPSADEIALFDHCTQHT